MILNNQIKGFGAVIFSAVILALSSTGVSRLIEGKLPLFYQGFSRTLFCALLIIIWLLFLKELHFKILKEDIKWFIGRSLAGFFGFLFFYIPVNNISVGATNFSYFAGTLLAGYFFAWLLFKERITQFKMFAMFLALTGLLLIYSQFDIVGLNSFVTLAFLGGASYIFWGTFPKKLKGKYTNLQITLVDFTIVTMIYGLCSLFAKEAWTIPEFNVIWMGSLALGLIWICVGLFIVYGFKHINASLGSLLLLVELPAAIFIGWAFYSEQLSLITWIGGILILLSCALPELYSLKISGAKKESP